MKMVKGDAHKLFYWLQLLSILVIQAKEKRNWVCITAGAREQIYCLANWTGIFQINCLHFSPKMHSFIEILMYVQESFLCCCGMVSKGMGHTVHQDLS